MAGTREFTFVDLFAGIGGFHAALSGLGGRCVLASEIDDLAKSVYELNWGLRPEGDIFDIVSESGVKLVSAKTRIDVLTAGFPCQPFSKSGFQRGRDEARGTLFDQIELFIRHRHPRVVILENVRNLAGPRHRHEFNRVIDVLRAHGYLVSREPAVFSPHRIAPEFGGRPQVRERLFIAATYSPRHSRREPGPIELDERTRMTDPNSWELSQYLQFSSDSELHDYSLAAHEVEWVEAWEEFVWHFRSKRKVPLPGHPLWSDEWTREHPTNTNSEFSADIPDWKRRFLRSNWAFYDANSAFIDSWRRRVGLDEFPASRRKFEWQAKDESSLWDCAIHFRPSGIRARPFTYLPALVAMNQTSILGPLRRRITPSEAAVLQGLPIEFEFGDQPQSQSYRQLGNGVNVGVVWQVVRALVMRDRTRLMKSTPELVGAVDRAPLSPDSHDRYGEKRVEKQAS